MVGDLTLITHAVVLSIMDNDEMGSTSESQAFFVRS